MSLPAAPAQGAYVALNITKRCNQRCPFCFEGDRAGWAEPSLDEVRRLLEEAKGRGPGVLFMGAEALLRGDILEVVRAARSLGLEAAAFTNGMALAREGFAGALADAGLAACHISAHHADARGFERGTGTPAKGFERFLRGLENLAGHNRRRPERAIAVFPQTLLYRHNAGRLAAVEALLRRALGASFASYLIGCVTPCASPAAETLLEPLAERREELSAFLSRWKGDVPLWFSRVPLCLIPGWEDRSYDVRLAVEGGGVLCNFADKSRLEAMHDPARAFARNPYRWVCRDCALLGLCPMMRTSWEYPAFAPRLDQRFEPPRGRSVDDVLRRLFPAERRRELPAAREKARATAKGLLETALPERALHQALRGLDAGGVRCLDVWCDGGPVLCAELEVSGRRVDVRLSAPGPGARGVPVRYLLAEFLGAPPPAAARAAALRALESVELPPLEAWEGFPRFDLRAGALALGVWGVLGGRERFGAWRVLGWDLSPELSVRARLGRGRREATLSFWRGSPGPKESAGRLASGLLEAAPGAPGEGLLGVTLHSKAGSADAGLLAAVREAFAGRGAWRREPSAEGRDADGRRGGEGGGGLAAGVPLRHAALNITKRCSQRCVFCFEGDREGWGEPALDEVKALLERVAKEERKVIFMGAEALLRPDILDVIRHGRGLGLTVSAFSNGQPFAREGFVEALAEAGLADCQVSAHYADAESFARGTQTPARLFDRFLLGLENLAAHNRARPGRAIGVFPKTVLSVYNAGRLAAVAGLLRRALGDSFESWMLGGLSPTEARTGETLLEPLAARREELSALLDGWPGRPAVCFSMVPLCLIPGREHLSYDARIVAGDVRMSSNFADKTAIGAMHDYVGGYRDNPYRWACRECSLLPLCPTARTSWASKAFLPSREQRPQPAPAGALEGVLARVAGAGRAKAAVQDRARRPRGAACPQAAALNARRQAGLLLEVPVPEAAVVGALRSMKASGVEVEDVFCDGAPILRAELRRGAARFAARLALPAKGRLGALVGGLDVRFDEPGPPEEARRAVLEALAASPGPSPADWSASPGFDAKAVTLASELSALLGPSAWPGAAVGGWTVAALELTPPRDLRVSLSWPGDGGGSAALWYGEPGPDAGPAAGRERVSLYEAPAGGGRAARRLGLEVEAAALGSPETDRLLAALDERLEAKRSAKEAAGRKLLALLDRQFEKAHGVRAATRLDGDVLSVTLAGRRWTLFFAPKAGYGGAHFDQTPGFFVCIRGGETMSPAEERRLRAYVALVSRHDRALAAVLRRS